MNFTAKGVREYSKYLVEDARSLSAVTLWIGHIIYQDPEIASELGGDILMVVSNASERLNELMANGGPIEAV